MTTFIFSFLRPKSSTPNIEASSPEFETFRHYINQRFPLELQNILVEHLQPLGEKVHLEHIGLILSEDWRNLLPTASPWLRDLDLLKEFQLSATIVGLGMGAPGPYVGASGAFEPGGCMQGAPLGLRNRRRIWRMLIEMKAPRGEWRTEGNLANEDSD